MIAKNCTIGNLEQALAVINADKYEGNVAFERLDQSGNRIIFLLRVKDSKGPGHRLGFLHPWSNHKQRRLAKACWHVHGHFFDALFEIAPDAIVVSRWHGEKIMTKDHGNWQDSNAGSQMFPVMFSELCECE